MSLSFLVFNLATGWMALADQAVRVDFTAMASVEMVQILGKYAPLEGVRIKGFSPGLVPASAKCFAQAIRPDDPNKPGIDPSNRFECTFSYVDRPETGEITVDLSTEPIYPWGNIADRIPFSLGGKMGKQLFGVMRKAVLDIPIDPENGTHVNRMYSDIILGGPGGYGEGFFLNQYPDGPYGGNDVAPPQFHCDRRTAFIKYPEDSDIDPWDSQAVARYIDQLIEDGYLEITNVSCTFQPVR